MAIEVIDTIKPKADFPVVEASDVDFKGERLSEIIDKIKSGAEFVTPQKYGAKADGINDDTEAIQAAVSNNRFVYFPEGRYLISESIKTYTDNEKSVNIVLNPAAIIFTNKKIECLFDIGGIEPDADHVIGSSKLFEGGVLDCENTEYGIIFEQPVADYHLSYVQIKNAINGIMLGRKKIPAFSQDIYINNCTIVGKGCRNYDSHGVEINSKDNTILSCRIYAFETSLFINGQGTQIDEVHDLKYDWKLNRGDEGFADEFSKTVFAKMTDRATDSVLNRCYADTAGVFVDSECLRFRLTNSMYYSYINDVPVELVKIKNKECKCIIDNNTFIVPPLGEMKGIHFVDMSDSELSRIARSPYVSVGSNVIDYPNRLRIGDIMNGNKGFITTLGAHSNYGNRIWYSLGYFTIHNGKPTTFDIKLCDYIVNATVKMSLNEGNCEIEWDETHSKNTVDEISLAVKFIKSVDGLLHGELFIKKMSVFPVFKKGAAGFSVTGESDSFAYYKNQYNEIGTATDSGMTDDEFAEGAIKKLEDMPSTKHTSYDWKKTHSISYEMRNFYNTIMLISVHFGNSSVVYTVFSGELSTLINEIKGNDTIDISITVPTADEAGEILINTSNTARVSVAYL